MNTDESFKAYKRDDQKVVYKIKLDNEKQYQNSCIISKILKLDQYNQYDFAMTKPMPTSCIKEHPSPSWLKFNLLLEWVDSDDETGHLFVADIEFDKKKATERKYMYNGIIPPVIDK